MKETVIKIMNLSAGYGRAPILENISFDVFKGENKGLVIAEVELKYADQKFKTPSWIGIEVTQDRRFRNANLIANPFSKWKDKLTR